MPSNPVRVVVVAERDAFNSHLLREIASVCRIERVLTVAVPPARDRIQWSHFRAPISTLTNVVRTVVFGVLDRRMERTVERRLPSGPSPFEKAEQVTAVDLRGERGIALVADADLLILSGAPMLPERIFSVPRLGTVNLHCGLSRHYRGTHTIFYPLLRREYDAIGATLHYVDAGIDTGAVVAEGMPAMRPTDTMAEIWAETALVSATMMTSFLTAVAHGPVPGRRNDERGVLIRNRDRRVKHHVQMVVGRWLMGHRPPRMPARTRNYHHPVAQDHL